MRDEKDDRQSDLQYIINNSSPTIKGPGIDHGMLTGLQDHPFPPFLRDPSSSPHSGTPKSSSFHVPSLIKFMAIPHLLHTSPVLILPDSIQSYQTTTSSTCTSLCASTYIFSFSSIALRIPLNRQSLRQTGSVSRYQQDVKYYEIQVIESTRRDIEGISTVERTDRHRASQTRASSLSVHTAGAKVDI